MDLSIYKKYREDFIRRRTQQENEILDWASRLKESTLYEQLDIPYAELTLKCFCPELYAEDPKPEVYEQQWIKASNWINQINEIILAHNSKIVASFEEFEKRLKEA